MAYTLLRNAAALLTVGGISFLVDPALDPAGARPPVENTANQRRNPIVELPQGWEEVIDAADAIVVTHMHQDHFDARAKEVLDHTMPLLCQPEDVSRLRDAGFTNVLAVNADRIVAGVQVTRTAGRHGTGEIGRLMAPVSGFVFRASGEPVVYIAGDTVWCEEVADAIATHEPDVIVVNGSGASFLEGGPIVMTAADIAAVQRAAPDALIIVVHLEAINHCHETRDDYRDALPRLGVEMDRIRIPDDGETIRW